MEDPRLFLKIMKNRHEDLVLAKKLELFPKYPMVKGLIIKTILVSISLFIIMVIWVCVTIVVVSRV